MQLPLLLKDFFLPLALPNVDVLGLTLDSRNVKPHDLFFAYPGTHSDGREFIQEAIQRGASVVLLEGPSEALHWQDKVLFVTIPHLSQKVALIAAQFFDHPAEKMPVIGITGTNGKTSSAYFIGAALKHLGKPCGIIGTLGSGLYGEIPAAPSLTTPDAVT